MNLPLFVRIKIIILFILTNPFAWAEYDTRSIFKQSLTGLNSEFSFSKTSCLTKAEEPRLPYYLHIAGGRIIGFIPFSRVLVLWEMQQVSSRIWIHVALSISFDDNHYTIILFIKFICIVILLTVYINIMTLHTYTNERTCVLNQPFHTSKIRYQVNF